MKSMTFAGLTGWRRNGLLMGLGVCATAALPPFYLFPLLVPAFAGLFLMLWNAPTVRRAAWDGWWWGLGHFMSGLYWMCISLLVEPEKFAWLIPFTLIGLNGLIALHVAMAGWLFARLKSTPLASVLLFAALWMAVEYLRGHWFTGFPWNLIGYAANLSAISMQPLSVIGIYGMGFVIVLLATLPALSSRKPLAIAVLLCVAAWLGAVASGGT